MELQKKRSVPIRISDDAIIELYWQRDESAITHTDVKYGKYLLSVAYNIVNDKSDCEECLNDTYLGAWNSMPPEHPSMLKAFLTTIMRRTAVNRYNYNNRKKRVPSEMIVSLSEIEGCVSDGVGVDDEFNAEELGRLISAFVRELPDRRRYIFMSRYYVAQPIETIASELGVSRSTVNKEIAAIKADLKNLLESEGFNV